MNDESKIFNISVRSVITLILTLTICGLAVLARDVKEPLYSAFLLALGFYFGQKTAPNGIGGTTNVKEINDSTVTVAGPIKPIISATSGDNTTDNKPS